MSIPKRSYIIFGVMVLVAAYGVGQVWSTASSALMEGNWSPVNVATVVLSVGLIAISSTVIGRILYVIHNATVSTVEINTDIEEAEDAE